MGQWKKSAAKVFDFSKLKKETKITKNVLESFAALLILFLFWFNGRFPTYLKWMLVKKVEITTLLNQLSLKLFIFIHCICIYAMLPSGAYIIKSKNRAVSVNLHSNSQPAIASYYSWISCEPSYQGLANQSTHSWWDVSCCRLIGWHPIWWGDCSKRSVEDFWVTPLLGISIRQDEGEEGDS